MDNEIKFEREPERYDIPSPHVGTVPSHVLEATSDPLLFRLVDRAGDWLFYYHETLKMYMPAVNYILGIGWPKGQGLIEWMKKLSKEEQDAILKSAGERGSKVHSAIRDLIVGVTVEYEFSRYKNDKGEFDRLSAEEWDCLCSWNAWADVFHPRQRAVETSVWHSDKSLVFAGTKDFDGDITVPAGMKVYIDDKLVSFPKKKKLDVLLDWKTSSAIHDEYPIQISSYDRAGKRHKYTGIVRLNTKHKNGGFEMRLWSAKATTKHFKLFQNAYQNFVYLTGYTRDFVPEIKQIPLSLAVQVPLIGEAKKETV